MRPAAPIPMPAQSGLRPLAEQAGQQIGLLMRRVQAETERVRELLEAVRTKEGRRRNVVPLALLTAATGLVVGMAFGLWRGRHGRTR